MAMSLDAKIGSHPLESDQERRSYGFTNKDDQEHVRALLKSADAVITGANSMRASSGAWNQKNAKGVFPVWIIMSRSGLDDSLKFWDQVDIPRVLIGSGIRPQSDRQKNSGVIFVDSLNKHPAKTAKEWLDSQKIETCLLFGGGEINQLFYSENLVDELKITICPIIVGTLDAPSFVAPGLPAKKHLTLMSSNALGNHVFLSYSVQKH